MQYSTIRKYRHHRTPRELMGVFPFILLVIAFLSVSVKAADEGLIEEQDSFIPDNKGDFTQKTMLEFVTSQEATQTVLLERSAEEEEDKSQYRPDKLYQDQLIQEDNSNETSPFVVDEQVDQETREMLREPEEETESGNINRILKRGISEPADGMEFGEEEFELALELLNRFDLEKSYKVLNKISETPSKYQGSSQYIIGIMRLLGLGVSQDLPLGLMYVNFAFRNGSSLSSGMLTNAFLTGSFGSSLSVESAYRVINQIGKEAFIDNKHNVEYFEHNTPVDFESFSAKGLGKDDTNILDDLFKSHSEPTELENSEHFKHMIEMAETRDDESGSYNAFNLAYYFVTGSKRVTRNYKKAFHMAILAIKRLANIKDVVRPDNSIYWDDFDNEHEVLQYAFILADMFIRAKVQNLPEDYIISGDFYENPVIEAYVHNLGSIVKTGTKVSLTERSMELTSTNDIQEVINTINTLYFEQYNDVGCTILGQAFGLIGSLILNDKGVSVSNPKNKNTATRLMYTASAVGGCSMGLTGNAYLAMEAISNKDEVTQEEEVGSATSDNTVNSDDNTKITPFTHYLLAAIKLFTMASYAGSGESMYFLAGIVSQQVKNIVPRDDREKWAEVGDALYSGFIPDIELGSQIALKSAENGYIGGNFLATKLLHKKEAVHSAVSEGAELIRRVITDPSAINIEDNWKDKTINNEGAFWRYLMCGIAGNYRCAYNAAMMLRNNYVDPLSSGEFSMSLNINSFGFGNEIMGQISGHTDLSNSSSTNVNNMLVLEGEDAVAYLRLLLFSLADLNAGEKSDHLAKYYRLIEIKQHPVLAFLLNESKLLPLKTLTYEQKESINEHGLLNEDNIDSFISFWAHEERKRVAFTLDKGYNLYGLYFIATDIGEMRLHRKLKKLELDSYLWPTVKSPDFRWTVSMAQNRKALTLSALWGFVLYLMSPSVGSHAEAFRIFANNQITILMVLIGVRVAKKLYDLVVKLVLKIRANLKNKKEEDGSGENGDGPDEDGANDGENNNTGGEDDGNDEAKDTRASRDAAGSGGDDDEMRHNRYYDIDRGDGTNKGVDDCAEYEEEREIEMKNCRTLDELLEELGCGTGNGEAQVDLSSDDDFLDEPDTISSEFRGIHHSASDID